MSKSVPSIVHIKNDWLYHHIDVAFPTKESLKGKELYKRWVESRSYEVYNQSTLKADVEEIHLVDFHRLTVMFALLQAKRWKSENDQALIVEFLTQIIFSEPCSLYMGFHSNEPVAAAIVTRSGNDMLISDLVSPCSDTSAFASNLISYFKAEGETPEHVYVEC
ncbi:flavodoxin [Vibrio sp. TRT 21S02]|uniref:flavodoxin n=1 Tax=unclassified Vibrio TaxID=2614977 RepID=UPI00349F1F44